MTPTLLDDKPTHRTYAIILKLSAIIPFLSAMILGGVIMSFFVWGLYKRKIDDNGSNGNESKILSFMEHLTGYASDILILAIKIHSFRRLSKRDWHSLQTTFGATF